MRSISKLLKRHGRRTIALSIAAIILSAAWFLNFLWWKGSPAYWILRIRLLESQDAVPETEAYLTQGLAATGPVAVDSILEEVEKHSPWDSPTWLAIGALPLLGEEARQELYRRIGTQTDPKLRIFYIYCLQEEFGDYTRMSTWLRDLKRLPYSGKMLEKQLQIHYGLTVEVADSKGNLNPAFMKLWRHRRSLINTVRPH